MSSFKDINIEELYDNKAVLMLFGALLNNPTTLLKHDRFKLEVSDFVARHHRIVFSAINNLVNSGVDRLDSIAIDSYLNKYPEQYEIFRSNRGLEALEFAKNSADGDNFVYYYNRVKKFSLLRAYLKSGVDIRFIYDPDELNSDKKEKMQNGLDKMSINEIINLVDMKIVEVRQSFEMSADSYGQRAGQNIVGLIDDLLEKPAIGLPLNGSYINGIVRGARLKKLYMRSAPTGVGKAIPNYTKIPTPEGFKRVDEVKIGSYIFGRNGKPTKVVGVHPQESEKEINKVTFADGRVAETCDEHLWEYFTDRRCAHKTKTTKQILEEAKSLGGFKGTSGYTFKVPINGAVEYNEKEYGLKPYTFGALLGDGSFRYVSGRRDLTFSAADEEIISTMSKLEGWHYEKEKSENYSWFFRKEKNTNNRISVEESIGYKDLWNAKSEDKFIPDDYLLGSIDQRMCLLQGLLDTDGSIDKKGRVAYHTISVKLKDDVVSLARSLGYIPTIIEDIRDKYSTGVCYKINIQMPHEDKLKVFRFSRKLNIANKYVLTLKRKEHKDYNPIVNIEKMGFSTEMTCFTVDNDEHLFLMNDYIVTHNTRFSAGDAINLAVDKVWDSKKNDWVSNGISMPSLFITTELEIQEIQTLFLAFVSNVNEAHILDGEYDEGEKERVIEAAHIIKGAPIWIEHLSNHNIQQVDNMVTRHKLKHDVHYVFFDYVHTTLKILAEIASASRGVRLREDNVLLMFVSRLKKIANELGVFIYTATQVNGDWDKVDQATQNLLRGVFTPLNFLSAYQVGF